MRIKKSIINSSINIISLVVLFIPNLIVRKIFLKTLGNDILGLVSLYTNIIGWLSIVELGIGGAIVYSLYKPFADKNYNEIKAYINFYGEFYKKVGIFILILGVMISPFINLFIHGEIDFVLARIGFLLFIINTFLSYMFTHKLCLLNVAQESYKVTLGVTMSKLIIIIMQIIMLKTYPSFILYISIQIIVNLIYYILINVYILKTFPWIRRNKVNLEKTRKKDLMKNIRAMFMHQIGSLIVFSTDNIIISSFIGLSALTTYVNYQTIINPLQNMVTSALNGITASVGNLIAEGNKQKSFDIHKKVFFANFWITSFMVISLYNTLNQFIGLWIGESNIIDKFTFNILMVNLYFTLMRGAVGQFQLGSGQFYQDRFAPICEAIINLGLSLFLVKHIGLPGVFIGTLISNFTVVFWTKPLVVYKYVFERNVLEYFKMYFKYVMISIIALLISELLTLPVKYSYTIQSFIINCFINIISINFIYIIIFIKTDEFKYYFNIIKNIYRKIFIINTINKKPKKFIS